VLLPLCDGISMSQHKIKFAMTSIKTAVETLTVTSDFGSNAKCQLNQNIQLLFYAVYIAVLQYPRKQYNFKCIDTSFIAIYRVHNQVYQLEQHGILSYLGIK